jgi:hypothetical protein
MLRLKFVVEPAIVHGFTHALSVFRSPAMGLNVDQQGDHDE